MADRITNTKTLDGVAWECVKRGIDWTYWRQVNEHRARVSRNYGRGTYVAYFDDNEIGRLFRSLESAMRAANRAKEQAYG